MGKQAERRGRKKPNNVQAEAQARQKSCGVSREEAEEALRVHSAALLLQQSSEHLVGRATALLSLDRPREAMRDAKAALKLEPTSFSQLACKATVYQHLREFDKALSVIVLAGKTSNDAKDKAVLRQLKAGYL